MTRTRYALRRGRIVRYAVSDIAGNAPRGHEPLVKIQKPIPLPDPGRRTARRISEGEAVRMILRSFAQAVRSEQVRADVAHGGTVANAYRYPASTQTFGVAVDPMGRVFADSSEIAANKATLRGAAASTLGNSDLFDSRVSSPARIAAANEDMGRLAGETPTNFVVLHPELDSLIRGLSQGNQWSEFHSGVVGDWVEDRTGDSELANRIRQGNTLGHALETMHTHGSKHRLCRRGSPQRYAVDPRSPDSPHHRPNSGQYGEWERSAPPPVPPPPPSLKDTRAKSQVAEHLRGTRLAMHLLHLQREFRHDIELHTRLTAALQDRGSPRLKATDPSSPEDNWRAIGKLLKVRGHPWASAYNWQRIGEALEVDKLVRQYVRGIVKEQYRDDPNVFSKAMKRFDPQNGSAAGSKDDRAASDMARFWGSLRSHVAGRLKGIYGSHHYSDDALARSLRRQAYKEQDERDVAKKVPRVGERLFTPVEAMGDKLVKGKEPYLMKPWEGDAAEYLGYLPGPRSAERYRRRYARPGEPPGLRPVGAASGILGKLAGLFGKKRSPATTAFTHHLSNMTGGEALPAHKVETNREAPRGIGANEPATLGDDYMAGNRHRDTLRESLLASGHGDREASRHITPEALAAWRHNGIAQMIDSEAAAGRHGTARAIGVAAVRRLHEAGLIPAPTVGVSPLPMQAPPEPSGGGQTVDTQYGPASPEAPYQPSVRPAEDAPPIKPIATRTRKAQDNKKFRALLEKFRTAKLTRQEKVTAAFHEAFKEPEKLETTDPPTLARLKELARRMKLSRRGDRPVRYSSHEAFHRTMVSRANDSLPALVYADWLEENGQHGHAKVVRDHQQRAFGGSSTGVATYHYPAYDTDPHTQHGATPDVDTWPTYNPSHTGPGRDTTQAVAVRYHDPETNTTSYHVGLYPAEEAHRLVSQMEEEGVRDADLARTHIERSHGIRRERMSRQRYAAYRAPSGGMLYKGVFYPGGQTVPDVAKLAQNEPKGPKVVKAKTYKSGMQPPAPPPPSGVPSHWPVKPLYAVSREQQAADAFHAALADPPKPSRAMPVRPYRVKAVGDLGKEYHVVVHAPSADHAMQRARAAGHFTLSAEEHVPVAKPVATKPSKPDFIPRRNRTVGEKIGIALRGFFGGYSGKPEGKPRGRRKRMARRGRPVQYAAGPDWPSRVLQHPDTLGGGFETTEEDPGNVGHWQKHKLSVRHFPGHGSGTHIVDLTVPVLDGTAYHRYSVVWPIISKKAFINHPRTISTGVAQPMSEQLQKMIEAYHTGSVPWYALLDKVSEEYPAFSEGADRHHKARAGS